MEGKPRSLDETVSVRDRYRENPWDHDQKRVFGERKDYECPVSDFVSGSLSGSLDEGGVPDAPIPKSGWLKPETSNPEAPDT